MAVDPAMAGWWGQIRPPPAIDLASPTAVELAAMAAGGGTGRNDCSARKETAARPGKGGCGSTPSGGIRPDLVGALLGRLRCVQSGGRHQRMWRGEQRWREDVRCGAGERVAARWPVTREAIVRVTAAER